MHCTSGCWQCVVTEESERREPGKHESREGNHVLHNIIIWVANFEAKRDKNNNTNRKLNNPETIRRGGCVCVCSSCVDRDRVKCRVRLWVCQSFKFSRVLYVGQIKKVDYCNHKDFHYLMVPPPLTIISSVSLHWIPAGLIKCVFFFYR